MPSHSTNGRSAWRFALVGALVSLPVTALLNWLPNADADVAGGMMIVGAFAAGGLAVARSADPDAAGLRAGVLAGVVGVLTPLVTAEGPPIAALIEWPSPWGLVALAAVVVVLSTAFGAVFGHLGGWVVSTVSRRSVAPA